MLFSYISTGTSVIINEIHATTTATLLLLRLSGINKNSDISKYLPSDKTFWKRTADQEHVNTNKNPY